MPLTVFAAGSLRAALTAYAASRAGEQPVLVFGPAGLLRREIEAGRACDVFLSANTAHPAALARSVGTACRVFARNPLCVVVRPRTAVQPGTLLDRLLDPAIRLGTSTPGADPSGDYAQEMFRRADEVRPGAGDMLRAKAIPVVGAAIPDPGAPAKEGGIARLFEDGTIDAFICYRTTARALPPGLTCIQPPPELAVTAEYGLVVLQPGDRAAAFVDELQAEAGTTILARYGFDVPRVRAVP